MKLWVKAGSTSVVTRVKIQDATSSVGGLLTGLAYNTSGLKFRYIRDDQSTVTAVTPVTASVGTWASGGFVQVDATNWPGLYEIGIPDAALASSKAVQILLFGAANMVPVPLEIELTAVDPQSATGFVSSVPAVVGAVGSVTAAVSLSAGDEVTLSSLRGTLIGGNTSIFTSQSLVNAPGGSGGDPWATDVSTGYSGNEAGALLYATSQGVGALANVFAFGTVSAVGATTVTAAFTGTMPSASAFGGGNLWCNLLTLPRAPAKALIASATQTDSTHLQFTLSSAFSIAPQVGDVIAVG